MLLDGLAPLLELGAGQKRDELADSLVRLQESSLMRFGQDEAGAMYYQARADHAAPMLALLDDHARASLGYSTSLHPGQTST